METLLIIGILLLLPLVLWRCKRFCEKHPSTIPFRTVPSGCLYPMVFAGLAAIATAISVFFAVFDFASPSGLRDSDKESAAWNTIFLPKLQDCPIAFEQRPTHPFLAEYDYRIRLGERDDPAYFQLWPNTGGRTYINVYRVADGKLLLKDKDASYLVDLSRRQVYLARYERGTGESEQEIHSAIPLSEKAFDKPFHPTIATFQDGPYFEFPASQKIADGVTYLPARGHTKGNCIVAVETDGLFYLIHGDVTYTDVALYENKLSVAFEDLPADWRCLRCKQPKDWFNPA